MRELFDFIEKKAINLLNIGVNNFSFLKSDAIEFLDKLEKNKILLYGGDFLESINDEITYNYTNWATEEKDFSKNIEYAKKFIEQYATDNTYIEFVTDIDLYKLFNEYKDEYI